MPIGDFAGELYSGLHKRMIEALNLIARSARARVSWSSKIRGAIKVGEVKEQSGEVFGYIEIGGTATNEHGQPVNIAEMARAYEYGSGEHATRKGHHGIGKYVILPKNAPYLAFMGTNEFAGHLVKTPIVHHPGVAPRPFLVPAVQENKAKIKQLLGDEFHQYISKAIRFSWSKSR
jgi:hypothetical protein